MIISVKNRFVQVVGNQGRLPSQSNLVQVSPTIEVRNLERPNLGLAGVRNGGRKEASRVVGW